MSISRNTAQTLAGHLLVFIQGLVLTPFILKVAGPEVFGAYVLSLTWVGLLFGISSFGVGARAKRYMPSHSDKKERAAYFLPQFYFQLISIIILTLVTVFIFEVFSGDLGWTQDRLSVWVVLTYLIAYTVYSQMTDYFRYTSRVGVFNLSTVAQPYLHVAIAISIYWSIRLLNVETLFISLAVASSVIGGCLLVRVYREIGLRFQLPRKDELREEIRLGFPIILSYLVDFGLAGGDRYIIAALMSLRDVGAYVPAYVLGSLPMVIPKAFGVVLPALISQRVDSEDDAGAKNMMAGAARVFLLVAIPFSVGAAILGENVLTMYASAAVADVAWPVIPIIAVASVFYGLTVIKSNLLFVRLKTSLLFRINLFSVIINVLVNFIFIKLFESIIVAALATLVSYSLSYILVSMRLRDDSAGFSLDFRWLLGVLACSVGMAIPLVISSLILSRTSFWAMVMEVIIGALVYIVLTLSMRSNRADFIGLVRSFKSA